MNYQLTDKPVATATSKDELEEDKPELRIPDFHADIVEVKTGKNVIKMTLQITDEKNLQEDGIYGREYEGGVENSLFATLGLAYREGLELKLSGKAT